MEAIVKYEPTQGMVDAVVLNVNARCVNGNKMEARHVKQIKSDLSVALAWDAEHGPTEEDFLRSWENGPRRIPMALTRREIYERAWKDCAEWYRSRYVAKEEPLTEIPLTEEQVKEKIADWIACKYGPSLPTVAGLLKELGLKAKEPQ